MADLGFLKDVEPQWRLALPTQLAEANFVPGERFDIHGSRQSFARWQVKGLSSHKITVRKRVILRNLGFSNH